MKEREQIPSLPNCSRVVEVVGFCSENIQCYRGLSKLEVVGEKGTCDKPLHGLSCPQFHFSLKDCWRFPFIDSLTKKQRNLGYLEMRRLSESCWFVLLM